MIRSLREYLAILFFGLFFAVPGSVLVLKPQDIVITAEPSRYTQGGTTYVNKDYSPAIGYTLIGIGTAICFLYVKFTIEEYQEEKM